MANELCRRLILLRIVILLFMLIRDAVFL